MSILFAGLLLGVFGMLVWAAPKRKRYRRSRRWTPVGDDSIDGEENDDVVSTVSDLGVFNSGGDRHESSHHVGGHEGHHHVGGHDVGGHDFGGHGYGGGHDFGGGDFGGGGFGGGDFGGGHH